MPNATQSQAGDAAQSKGGQQASQQATVNQATASTEGQSGRTYTQAEVDKIQSKKDVEIAALRTSNRAYESTIRNLKASNESLTDKVETLQSEFDQGYPADAQEAKKALDEEKRRLKPALARLAEADDRERKSLASVLSDESGIPVDELLAFDEPEKMKAYAWDHRVNNAVETRVETPEVPANPAVIPATNTGSGSSLKDLSPAERVTRGGCNKKIKRKE